MKLIGLTGPSGAGKSAVGKQFRESFVPVIDCDAVYHALLVPPSPCVDEIVSVFGQTYLLADGSLNRPALAKCVFADKEKLSVLNRISHKYVIGRVHEMLDSLSREGSSCAVLDAPTLLESGLDQLCDAVIAVTADEEIRVKRIMARDGISRTAALTRIKGQPDEAFYTSRADIVICNNGDEQALFATVREVLAKLGVNT